MRLIQNSAKNCIWVDTCYGDDDSKSITNHEQLVLYLRTIEISKYH